MYMESFEQYNKKSHCQACVFKKYGVKTRKNIPHTCDQKIDETFVPRKINREDEAKNKSIINFPTHQTVNGRFYHYLNDSISTIENFEIKVGDTEHESIYKPAIWYFVSYENEKVPYGFFLTFEKNWNLQEFEPIPRSKWRWDGTVKGFKFTTIEDCKIFTEQVSKFMVYGMYFHLIEMGNIDNDLKLRKFVIDQTQDFTESLCGELWKLSESLT